MASTGRLTRDTILLLYNGDRKVLYVTGYMSQQPVAVVDMRSTEV